jgi:hypothetical protein
MTMSGSIGLHQKPGERTVPDMPYDNSESKAKRPRRRRTMNLVVAGAVAAAPAVGCGTIKPAADAASHMDTSGPDEKADVSSDAMAMDTGATDKDDKDGKDGNDAGAMDAGKDAGDDANLDAYPDGIRG